MLKPLILIKVSGEVRSTGDGTAINEAPKESIIVRFQRR